MLHTMLSFFSFFFFPHPKIDVYFWVGEAYKAVISVSIRRIDIILKHVLRVVRNLEFHFTTCLELELVQLSLIFHSNTNKQKRCHKEGGGCVYIFGVFLIRNNWVGK